MRRSTLSLALVLSLLALPNRASAQESHVVESADLEAMVAARAATVDANRATLKAFLARPEVRRVASEAGVDVGRAETAVALLTPNEAADLAGRAQQLDAALAGGDRVVISTTALIIALLVLIIILVA